MLDKEIKRELPSSWKGLVPAKVFLEEAERLVQEAEKRQIMLRVMGGLGVAMHSPESQDFAKNLGRTGAGVVKGQEYTDIDFMSYRTHRDRIKQLFSDMGYAKRRATLSSAASERQIYYHPKGWFYVDIFYDRLIVANHPVDFRGRLEQDYPTVSVTDMLLEKIQMWEAFGIKDLKDCLILLKAHKVQEQPEENTVNASYIAKLLAKDWGFWFTATTNLRKIRTFITEIDELGVKAQIDARNLRREDREEIAGRLDALLARIDREPKSLGWRLRSKAGTKKRWYNPVERPETVSGFGIWDVLLEKEQPGSA
ncbi:MAG: hypothetical protein JSV58_03915 [Candidatus Bathyarchaeota archaeon]|nr:MAG: hypothetical protein JSV58_03915 [Candidatus Bathyarchaeota archaeon]